MRAISNIFVANFPPHSTVGWVIWPVKTRPRYDLWCVRWDVKPYSINYLLVCCMSGPGYRPGVKVSCANRNWVPVTSRVPHTSWGLYGKRNILVPSSHENEMWLVVCSSNKIPSHESSRVIERSRSLYEWQMQSSCDCQDVFRPFDQKLVKCMKMDHQ